MKPASTIRTLQVKNKNPFATPSVIKILNYRIEQQEELGRSQILLDKLEAFGEDKIAMRLLDNEFSN